MTYVLGSLGVGALGSAPKEPPTDVAGVLTVASIVADPALRPVIKVHLVANPGASNWAIFNLTRFGKPVTDAQATQMADKEQYVEPYKTFRNAVATALRPLKKSGELANALRYHTYRLIDQERAALLQAGFIQPPKSAPPPDDKAKAASTTDNTMLFVGLAAAAVIGIGLMRRRQ